MRKIDLNDVEAGICMEDWERGHGRPVERHVWMVVSNAVRFKWLIRDAVEMTYKGL
jgi:hypothetical protein